MSTLAIDGSSGLSGGNLVRFALRYADLALLAASLPIFILAGWPLLGYAVAAAAWLLQRGVHLAAERRSARALAAGDRPQAEDGLAAAVLTLVLVTVFLGGRFLSRLFGPQEASG